MADDLDTYLTGPVVTPWDPQAIAERFAMDGEVYLRLDDRPTVSFGNQIRAGYARMDREQGLSGPLSHVAQWDKALARACRRYAHEIAAHRGRRLSPMRQAYRSRMRARHRRG